MPRFPSLRSFKGADVAGELAADSNSAVHPAHVSPDPDYTSAASLFSSTIIGNNAQMPFPMPVEGKSQPVSFSSAVPDPSAALMPPASTLPVVPTLPVQSTTRAARTPVVIHGSRLALQRKAAAPVGKPLPSRVRSLIVLGATGGIFLLILFSLSPLNNTYHAFAFLNGATQWVEMPLQNRGLIAAPVATPTSTVSSALSSATDPSQGTTAPVVVSSVTLSKSQYVDVARQDAASVGIPPEAFVRQIQLESGFNPGAVSPGGAVGIAQFMPATAAGLGVNPYDPISALSGAARYMANLAASFGGDYSKGLAAYNAGSGAVQRAINAGGANWLAFMNGTTQGYVRTIMG